MRRSALRVQHGQPGCARRVEAAGRDLRQPFCPGLLPVLLIDIEQLGHWWLTRRGLRARLLDRVRTVVEPTSREIRAHRARALDQNPARVPSGHHRPPLLTPRATRYRAARGCVRRAWAQCLAQSRRRARDQSRRAGSTGQQLADGRQAVQPSYALRLKYVVRRSLQAPQRLGGHTIGPDAESVCILGLEQLRNSVQVTRDVCVTDSRRCVLCSGCYISRACDGSCYHRFAPRATIAGAGERGAHRF